MAATRVRAAPATYKTFDQFSQREAESRGEAIMDFFFLCVIGFVVAAFVVYVAASLRQERQKRMRSIERARDRR